MIILRGDKSRDRTFAIPACHVTTMLHGPDPGLVPPKPGSDVHTNPPQFRGVSSNNDSYQTGSGSMRLQRTVRAVFSDVPIPISL